MPSSTLRTRRNASSRATVILVKTRSAPGEADARGAEAAFSLAQACRVARLSGDLRRLANYQKALEGSLQFLGTLQYTEANTQHFVEWFRPAIVGGFHFSHQDGNLRIDYAQNALLAQIEYLANQVEW